MAAPELVHSRAVPWSADWLSTDDGPRYFAHSKAKRLAAVTTGVATIGTTSSVCGPPGASHHYADRRALQTATYFPKLTWTSEDRG